MMIAGITTILKDLGLCLLQRPIKHLSQVNGLSQRRDFPACWLPVLEAIHTGLSDSWMGCQNCQWNQVALSPSLQYFIHVCYVVGLAVSGTDHSGSQQTAV